MKIGDIVKFTNQTSWDEYGYCSDEFKSTSSFKLAKSYSVTAAIVRESYQHAGLIHMLHGMFKYYDEIIDACEDKEYLNGKIMRFMKYGKDDYQLFLEGILPGWG